MLTSRISQRVTTGHFLNNFKQLQRIQPHAKTLPQSKVKLEIIKINSPNMEE
jgi:hypothetical protein